MPTTDRLGRAPQAEVLTPGYKYNLTDINAAIALTSLHKLEQLNARRHDIATQYQHALVNLPFQPGASGVATYPFWHLSLFVSMNNVAALIAIL